MELKKIPDAAGNSLTVLDYQGRWYPAFPEAAIRGIATFEAREDDVVVCAYPKSGTHWVWEMVRVLLAGTVDLPLVEKDDAMIEFIVPEELQALPSPRPLNTHVHFELLPPDMLAKKSKLVYVTRDPRDMAVSYYNHHKKLVEYYEYKGEWKDYLPMLLEGQVDYESWFAYTKGWEEGIASHPELPVLVTSYEALHADTMKELQRLVNFLSVSADESFLKQVIKKTSFDNMRATKGATETFVDTGSPIMYRKGKVGDWKNWFTVAQSDHFNAVFEGEMSGTQAYQLYSHTKEKQLRADRNV